jgi:hypothetical protein
MVNLSWLDASTRRMLKFLLNVPRTPNANASNPQPSYPAKTLCKLKVRHPPIITPIPTLSPPQRLILRPPHLPRLRIRVALKFRLSPLSYIRMELFSVAFYTGAELLSALRSSFGDMVVRLGRMGRLIDFGGTPRCAERSCRRFLQLLEALLLLFWKAWWGWSWLECGEVASGVG